MQDLPFGLESPHPLIFFYLKGEKPSLSPALSFSNLLSSIPKEREIYTFISLSAPENPENLAYLLQTTALLDTFDLIFILTDSSVSSPLLPSFPFTVESVTLSPKADVALQELLLLDSKKGYHLPFKGQATPPLFQYLPLLSKVGKKILLIGTYEVLRALYKEFYPSSTKTLVEKFPLELSQLAKPEARGLIWVDSSLDQVSLESLQQDPNL
ncbi:MAG: hypothetical protein SNJ78_07245, partial [Spirochaetales bacterium]